MFDNCEGRNVPIASIFNKVFVWKLQAISLLIQSKVQIFNDFLNDGVRTIKLLTLKCVPVRLSHIRTLVKVCYINGKKRGGERRKK